MKAFPQRKEKNDPSFFSGGVDASQERESIKGATMENPFQFGKWLGEDMVKKGWAIKGKSRECDFTHVMAKIV
jgi:hypothetical protein